MIPFTDLKREYLSIKKEIDEAIFNVINKTNFILGEEVSKLETEIASYIGVKFGIGVASGTDAILLALIAAGIKPDDEVITTTMSFVATAESIVRAGAKPVFVDIDKKTYNIDVNKIEEKITSKTKAIVPVHLYGHPADMDTIIHIAKKYDLKVIEDCAQAMGANYKGKKVGSFGDAGCFSFFPAKVLGCYGDGGMIVTNNAEIEEKAKILRKHGSKIKNFQIMDGFNSRLDTIQASILLVKLKYLDNWVDLRNRNAEKYSKLLEDCSAIETPYIQSDVKHAFNYYTLKLRTENRNELKKHLDSNGISNGIYYPLSLHLQKVYKKYGYKTGDAPISENIQNKIISLPLFPGLRDDEINFIVDKIREFFN